MLRIYEILIQNQCKEIQFYSKRAGINYSSTTIDYIKLNENIEKMSKIADLIFVKLSFVGISSSALLITGINYFVYDLNEKAFYLPFPVMYVKYQGFKNIDFLQNWIFSHICIAFSRLPFNWRTPIGFAVALLGSYIAIYAVLLSIGPILSFFIGACWFIVVFAKDVTNDLSQFNAAELRLLSHAELKKRFTLVIQQLSDVKQLSKNEQ